MSDETIIEETLEAQPHGGSLKREKKKDLTGISYYGEEFDGYMKVDEYRDLIPSFKEYYYQRMIADHGSKLTHILKDFNKILKEEDEIDGGASTDASREESGLEVTYRKFHPNTTTVRRWKKKWDADIMAKKGLQLEVIDEKKRVQQVMKTRNSDGEIVEYAVPEYQNLEEGLQTFGGELLNDAMQMLRDDQELEDIFETDELIKRRNYQLNVFSHVTKMVQGKASLMLKASEEKRNNASFLMDLMNKASAGKVSVEEIQELKAHYQPKEEEHVVAA